MLDTVVAGPPAQPTANCVASPPELVQPLQSTGAQSKRRSRQLVCPKRVIHNLCTRFWLIEKHLWHCDTHDRVLNFSQGYIMRPACVTHTVERLPVGLCLMKIQIMTLLTKEFHTPADARSKTQKTTAQHDMIVYSLSRDTFGTHPWSPASA